MPDEYGSQEFKDAYKRAVAGDAAPMDRVTTSKGAWAWMVMQYLESRAFLDLAESTQKQRRKLLRDAAKKAGKKSPSAVTEASIRRVMIERPPHAANNFLKAFRGFYGWASQVGYIKRENDPTALISKNTAKGDGWDLWTPNQISAFRSRWPDGTMERRAFELLIHTGLRRGDVIALSRFHDRGDMIEIVAQKNKVLCYIPVTDALRSWMIADGGTHYLTDANGNALSSAMFGTMFGKACKAAGIPDSVRAHSLRKTAATADAENGRTAHWLMAKYGWLKLAEAERYTKRADRRLVIQGGKVRDGAKENTLGSIVSNVYGTSQKAYK